MRTFREQFEKLIRAYLSDQVRPMNPCACFVGNLLNGSGAWSDARKCTIKLDDSVHIKRTGSKMQRYRAEKSIRLNSSGTYTYNEILSLEKKFMSVWVDGRDEDSLFRAFEETLLLLRQIHESKGEIVEGYEFQKRELV